MRELSIFQLPFEQEEETENVEVVGLIVPTTRCDNGSCHALWMSLPFLRGEDIIIKPYEDTFRGVGFRAGFFNIDRNSFQPNERSRGHFSPELKKVFGDAYDYFTYIEWYLSLGRSDLPPTFQQWRSMQIFIHDDNFTPARILSQRPEIINPVIPSHY